MMLLQVSMWRTFPVCFLISSPIAADTSTRFRKHRERSGITGFPIVCYFPDIPGFRSRYSRILIEVYMSATVGDGIRKYTRKSVSNLNLRQILKLVIASWMKISRCFVVPKSFVYLYSWKQGGEPRNFGLGKFWEERVNIHNDYNISLIRFLDDDVISIFKLIYGSKKSFRRWGGLLLDVI